MGKSPNGGFPSWIGGIWELSLESEGVCVRSTFSFAVRSGHKNSRSNFETDQVHWPYRGYLKLNHFRENSILSYRFLLILSYSPFFAKTSRDFKFSY